MEKDIGNRYRIDIEKEEATDICFMFLRNMI